MSESGDEDVFLGLLMSDEDSEECPAISTNSQKAKKSKKGGRLLKRGTKRERETYSDDDEMIVDSDEETKVPLKSEKVKSSKTKKGDLDYNDVRSPIATPNDDEGAIVQAVATEDKQDHLLDDIVALPVERRRVELLKLWRSAEGGDDSSSVMHRILCLDSVYHLKLALQNGSINNTDGEFSETYTIGEVLLQASALGSSACTEFLLCTDYSSNKDGEELPIEDSTIGDKEVDRVRVVGSKNVISQMKRGSLALCSEAGHRLRLRAFWPWSAPFLCALYAEQNGVAKVYCDFCPAHVLTVLRKTVPSDPEGDTGAEQVSALFDLLRPQTYFALLSALKALDCALVATTLSNSSDIATIKSRRKHERKKLSESGATGAGAGVKTVSFASTDLMEFLEVTRTKSGSTLLHWACESDDMVPFVEQLVQLAPPLLQARDRRGLTAVHHACAVGCAEVLRCIITYDRLDHTGESCVNVIDEQGWSPFLYALMREKVECAMLALNAGQTGTALYQLRLLGRVVQMPKDDDDEVVNSASAQTDEQVRKMIRALGTVREFRTILNSVVRANLSLLDEDLGYLLMYPHLLSLENKLLAARKILVTLDQEATAEAQEYPIVRSRTGSGGAATPVYLLRDDPWKDLCRQCGVRTVPALLSRVPAEAPARKAVRMFRSAIILQFDGSSETGIGHGVERETLESICNATVRAERGSMRRGATGHRSSSSSSSSSSEPRRGREQDGCCIFRDSDDSSGPLHLPLPLTIPVPTPTPNPRLQNTNTNTSTNNISEVTFLNVPFEDREDARRLGARWDAGRRSWYVLAANDNRAALVRTWGARVVTTPMSSNNMATTTTTTTTTTTSKSSRDVSPLFVFGQLVGHLLLSKCAAAADAKAVRAHTDQAGNNITTLVGGNYLTVNLPPCFWALVLRRECSLADVEGLDPALYQSLLYVRDNEGVDALDMYFTVTKTADSGSGGGVWIKGEEQELVQDGASRRVTDRNKEEYLRLIVQHHTAGRMGPQAKVVRRGICSVVEPELLKLFSERDLFVCLQGSGTISVDDWKGHTQYQNCPLGLSDRRVGWFWRLIDEMSGIEKSKLLMFCTGTSRLPSGGFGGLDPKFTINVVPFSAATSLPTASTCFNLLKLPAYPDEASLRKNVFTATLYGSTGFSFT